MCLTCGTLFFIGSFNGTETLHSELLEDCHRVLCAVFLCVRVCVRVSVCCTVGVRASVRACVRTCMCVLVCVELDLSPWSSEVVPLEPQLAPLFLAPPPNTATPQFMQL